MGVMHPCHYPGCMKKFDRKYNLKCHLRIHSNEKPYRCHHQNCTRSFRWKSSLNHHLMSLDHTPAALRRARKARAQRKRITPATSPHTFVPQPSLDHHAVFDLPTLSPVSSVATYSHSPSPQPQNMPNIPQSQPHQLKLAHRINQPVITTSTIPISTTNTQISPAPQDLHFITRNHMSHFQSTNPISNTNQPSMYSQTISQYRPTSSTVTHPKTQSQQSIIAHLQDHLALPIKPLPNPLMPDPSIRAELRNFAEDSSPITCASEPETSLQSPAADTISLVSPSKKSDFVDFNSSAKPSIAQPLVSIFEEFSPVSLMPFSSSLDSLFPPNADPTGMKIF